MIKRIGLAVLASFVVCTTAVAATSGVPDWSQNGRTNAVRADGSLKNFAVGNHQLKPQSITCGKLVKLLQPLCKFPEGVPGPRGLTGPAGVNGLNGAKGDPGTNGVNGSKGDTGPTGATGAQGVPGTASAKGDKGDKGDQGIPGQNGLNGINGAKGDKGWTGDPGPKGDTGAKGATGLTGPQGNPGTPAPTLDYGVVNVIVKRGNGAYSAWAQYATPLGSPVGSNVTGGTFRFTCNSTSHLGVCHIAIQAAVFGSADHTLYPRLVVTRDGDGDGGGSTNLVSCEYADGSTGAGGVNVAHSSAASQTFYNEVLNIGGSADCLGSDPTAGDVTSITVPNGYYDVTSTFTFS